jgi:uncharacterized protein involved in type VI secretion and phage assembly
MVHAIQQIARHEVEQHWGTSLGVVKSVHGSNGEQDYACTVELRESHIVLPRVPIATSVIGSAALPREEDLVLVVFAGGDAHAPVVIGRLYSDKVAPPKNDAGEFVTILPGDEQATDKRLELRVKTPGDGTRSIDLVLDGSVKVALSINDEGVKIQAQDATFQLKQTSSSDGQAELKVGNAKVLLEQNGNVTIEAGGTLLLKGNKVEISGDTSVKVAGTTIDLN